MHPTMDDTIELIISGDFPADKREAVKEMVGRFNNFPAKAGALGLLSEGQKLGKLDKALELLGRYWDTHWHQQPSQIAGDTEGDHEFGLVNACLWGALLEEFENS